MSSCAESKWLLKDRGGDRSRGGVRRDRKMNRTTAFQTTRVRLIKSAAIFWRKITVRKKRWCLKSLDGQFHTSTHFPDPVIFLQHVQKVSCGVLLGTDDLFSIWTNWTYVTNVQWNAGFYFHAYIGGRESPSLRGQAKPRGSTARGHTQRGHCHRSQSWGRGQVREGKGHFSTREHQD